MPALSKKMKSLSSVSILIAVLIAGCAAPPVKPEHIARGDYAATKQYVARLIEYQMKKHNVTGLSIALVDDQKIVWAEGFGYADKASNIPAAPDTVYRVGSISKLFTATAAMQLAEQGRLDIDQPLEAFLPEFSIKTRFRNAGPITPRTIMTHHSGLPDNFLKGMWAENPEPFTVVVGGIHDDYVAYPPNFIFSYSNLGVTLLGHAVQRVTGEGFAAYLERALLRPLGMDHSHFSTRIDTPRMAKAYRDGNETAEPPLRDVPAGGLNSSVLDLARFLEMVFADGRSAGHQILRPQTLGQMLRPQNSDLVLDQGFHVGLGWILSGLGGIDIENAGPVAHHAGATQQYRSQLIALPKHKLGVVVLANSHSAARVVSGVATEALQLALEVKAGVRQPGRPKPEAVAGPPSAEQLQAFAGHYSTALGFATVTRHGGRLRAEISGKRFDLVPRSDGQMNLRYRLFGIFPVEIEELEEIGLSRADVSGRDILLAQTRGQKLVVGEKITPAPISESWLARVGDYRIVNGEGDATAALVKKVELRYRDGFLVVDLSTTEDSSTLPIVPVSDSEAIFRGLGRGMGETIRRVTVNAEEHLVFSGFMLKKTD